jgi:hypothetical protein
MEYLPHEINNQIIQCFGRCFHYKDTVESFLISAGVPKTIGGRYRDDPKFVWARKLLHDLSETEEGRITQRKILTALCRLRNLPDNDVPDKNAGLDALRKLKELTVEHQLIIDEKKHENISKKNIAEHKIKIAEERSLKLIALKEKFYNGTTGVDRQKIGYDLEDIIKELFSLFEIDYKKSYKTDTQQIDGYFKFEGFDYLTEAKWRIDQPTEGEIGSFQRKVKTKLESTRGVFFSINGFRPEVVNQFNGLGANIIFFTGEDLIHILEGRVHLKDALQNKVEKAAQYGIVYYKVY